MSLCFAHLSFAQVSANKTQSNFWENVRFGGGVGLSFGDGFFSGSLAPSAIYQFSPQFATGLGLSGSYVKSRNDFSSTVLGASILNFYSPIPEIQTSAEFEILNVDRNFESDFIDENYWYPALYLGLGYNTGNVTVGIRYDVLYDENDSIYAEPYAPFVRVFF
ncbi:alpha-ketoglutarate decarboxylase [Spongiivirga citrea]|uniref:Alpha-ketoglutarate decarboxylase n=2 Tax=Spongiivirga citrea TaxID=1481457 RepID=A0A6M0CW69_9FLAO|nr:alpha-ketoglutarate decarboxylase [Spongiivirga citrea]